jgi:hypothetical protein
MKPFRVKIARLTFSAALLGVISVVLADRPMQAAVQAEPLLRPAPLVLKDWRIANVSVHDVRFRRV